MILNFKCSSVFEKNYNSKKKIVVNQGSSRCFYANQKIITGSGTKMISEITNKDLVLSFNEDTKQNEFKKVEGVIKSNNTKKAFKVTLKNGEIIIATEDHKFYYEGAFYSLKHLVSLWKNGKMENNS